MKLTNENIAAAVEEIQKFFEQADVSTHDRTKINLLIEKALLRWSEHFGAEKDFEIKTRKWFGTPKVLIRIRSKEFNPLETPENYDDEIMTATVMKNLLQYESAGTTYRYQNGYNEIRIFSTKERKPIKIPGGNITTFTILLTQLGFTQDTIGPMMVADVFTVNSMSFFGMFVRNCEIYDLSHQVKFSANPL